MLRLGIQYQLGQQGLWQLRDFLADLASRKRKAIRRERREALASGLTIRALSGGDIRPRHWDAFFAFYMDTGRPQVGPALSDARLLRLHRRDHGGPRRS